MAEAEGLGSNLLLIAFCIGAVGLWISSRDLPIHIALSIVVIKISIILVYFAWLADGTWTFVDDIVYYYQARQMLQLGFNPVTALIDPNGRWQLLIIAGGSHILYIWWNLAAHYLFGSHYYSPVFLNVLLTFVSGYISVRILNEMCFDKRYQTWFLVFFLLHWDVLAWSSFANLKDTCVMTLTTLSIFLLIRYARKPAFLGLLAIVVVLFAFFWIRVYVSFLLLLAVLLWIIVNLKSRLKYVFLAAVVVLVFVLPQARYEAGVIAVRDVLYGLLRFPLTPRPWGIETSYSFLNLPTIFHWLFIFPMIYSGIVLWKRSKLTKLPLIYLLIIWVFFAMIPMLQGPRHRVQATFVVAWLQFHFLWMLLSNAIIPSKSAAIQPAQ